VPPRYDAAYLDNPKPEYPRLARRLGEQGTVLLNVYVNVNGAPEKILLHRSSGSPRLDQAARETVTRWKFVPARQGGQAVGGWIVVPITFVLQG
jgi:protein TonB